MKTLGSPTDRAGRIPVDPFLMVPGVSGVFAVGDVAALNQDGHPLPGVAQVAIQQGRYVGQAVFDLLEGEARGVPSDISTKEPWRSSAGTLRFCSAAASERAAS